jgi:hypothetical protein
MQNSVKSGEVRIFAKNIRSQVATIEGVLKSASFVRSGWSRHAIPLPEKHNHSLTIANTQSKMSDPFDPGPEATITC